jgi:hypothetical protein
VTQREEIRFNCETCIQYSLEAACSCRPSVTVRTRLNQLAVGLPRLNKRSRSGRIWHRAREINCVAFRISENMQVDPAGARPLTDESDLDNILSLTVITCT